MPEGCENAPVRNRTIILLASSCLLLAACGDSSGPAASESADVPAVPPTTLAYVTPTTGGPAADEVMDGVREALVGLLMERSSDSAVLEQQLAIYDNWMDRYPVHPVLGSHWTEEQAECAIVTMMRVEGIGRTGYLVANASTGGMSVVDAQALVQPVSYCVDLLTMVRAELTTIGVPQDVDCLLAGVAEEDVASWYVAVFTDGPAGFNAALGEGVDLTCPTDQ